MKIDGKELIYGGLGLILFILLYQSLKNKEIEQNLVETKEEEKKNFNSNKLPDILKPPTKLMEGEPIPEGAKGKNLGKSINW